MVAGDEEGALRGRKDVPLLLLGIVVVLAVARELAGLPLPSAGALLPRLLPFLPVALLGGLAVGFTGSSRAAGVYAAVALLLAPLWVMLPPGRAEAAGLSATLDASRYLELLLPHVYRGEGGNNLMVLALLGERGVPRPVAARLYVGSMPLLLGLLGLLAAPGLLAWAARLALLPLAIMASGMVMVLPSPVVRGLMFALQIVVLVLAGLGVAVLDKREDRGRASGAGLLVGSLAVVLAGGLFLAAARAGSEPPQRLAEPLVEAAMAQGHPRPPDELVAQTGALLQADLDRGAIVAFATMVALLLYLKNRGSPTLGLVVLVTAFDLLMGV
jgi:hypothetical protein